MKKVILFLFMISFTIFIFADNSVEFNEEMGFEINSHTSSSKVRTMRDIPTGGLLLIPDSGGDRVMAFYPDTGNLYDANFIPSDPTNLATPIAAALHPDGHSILVSDQIKDGLIKYDLNGNFMSFFAPAGGVNPAILDNVRGWGVKANGNILVTSAGGGNSDAVAEFDAGGNFVGNFIPPNATIMDSPFDIIYRIHQNDYLVSASTSDAVHQYNNAGSYVGDLVPEINFPEQVSLTSSGNLLVAGFSTPSGCYEYTSTGTYVGYYNIVAGLRGVHELPNGNILVTNSSGVYEINRSNQIVSTKISDVNGRFIHFVEGGGVGIDDPIEPSSIQNSPNPMKNSTVISFANAQHAVNASVEIYNTKGQLINAIPVVSGQTCVEWDGTDFNKQDVANGIYFYKLHTKDEIIFNKMLLLR